MTQKATDNLPDVLFVALGNGKWKRRELALQCSHRDFLDRRCQGTSGHKGVHWHYDEKGWFHCSKNEDDPEAMPAGIGGGTTPPGHILYRSPAEMQEHYYLSHRTVTEVTDPEEIARLERGEIASNESMTGASGVLEKIMDAKMGKS